MVYTDEGPKPVWTTETEDHVLMRYTLMEAARTCALAPAGTDG